MSKNWGSRGGLALLQKEVGYSGTYIVTSHARLKLGYVQMEFLAVAESSRVSLLKSPVPVEWNESDTEVPMQMYVCRYALLCQGLGSSILAT